MEILKTKKSFRKEFRRQLRYAISAAVGFLIAFSWRETILHYVNSFVGNYLEKNYLIPISSSLFLTIIGVLIIIISSKILKED